MDNKRYIVKILPYYIPLDTTQNMSIWTVAKFAMLHSKYKNQFLIISPPAANPSPTLPLNISYITENINKDSIAKQVTSNWNINHNVDQVKYTAAVIKKIKGLTERPALIEVENDYRLAGNIARSCPDIPVVLFSHTRIAKKNFFTKIRQYLHYIKPISAIIFVSYAHKNLFKQHFWYSKKPFFVIHNSFAHLTNLIELSPPLPWESKKNQIIFAGRATINKGYQEYLLGVAKALTILPNWQALAVLSVEFPKHEAEIQEFIAQEKLQKLITSGQLTIIINLPVTELFMKFRESKIAVFPTHKSFIEGLPLVGIEAGMGNCAIIASSVEGFVELCQKHALYLENTSPPQPEEINQKIIDLAADQEKNRQLAENVYQHIKTNHDINTLIKQYDNLREKYLAIK